MKIYKIASEKYFYYTNCVGSNGEDIQNMIDKEQKVEWAEFNQYVSGQ